MKKGRLGGSLGGAVVYSPRAVKKLAARRKAEEAYWRSMNGPVVVKKAGGENDGAAADFELYSGRDGEA